MYTKFSAGSINYDLVCTSDYMVERLINEDQVLEINFDGACRKLGIHFLRTFVFL